GDNYLTLTLSHLVFPFAKDGSFYPSIPIPNVARPASGASPPNLLGSAHLVDVPGMEELGARARITDRWKGKRPPFRHRNGAGPSRLAQPRLLDAGGRGGHRHRGSAPGGLDSPGGLAGRSGLAGARPGHAAGD